MSGSLETSKPLLALNYSFENDWQSDTLITRYNIICDGEYCEGIFCELANINSLGLAGFFIGAMTFGQVNIQSFKLQFSIDVGDNNIADIRIVPPTSLHF